MEKPPLSKAQVVIDYDDPRGSRWHGPIEDYAAAEARLERECSRPVRGKVWLRKVAAATAIALAFCAPAHAGMHSDQPGELMLPTITTDPTFWKSHTEFNFALCTSTLEVDNVKVKAVVIVPAETWEGKPLDKKASCAQARRTRMHYGIFDNEAHALRMVRFLNEPLGPNQ